EETHMRRSTRPDWVNLYLADASGGSRGGGGKLVTGVAGSGGQGGEVPVDHLIAQNYPNPFNPSTIISFGIPPSLTGSLAEVVVYDLNGQIVKRLLKRELPSGNYMTRWDGTNDSGRGVSSGVYLYRVRSGDQQVIGKMMLLK
ncbi:MAG: T9SS type A sorting domain-containing protein, partial [Bacteroidota bacterium]